MFTLPVFGRSYPKAPIIEAVIEVKFAAAMNEAPLARASVSFGRYYPTIQEFQQVQIQIGPGADGKLAAPATTSPSKQYRRSGNDEQELVILTPISIVVSQLVDKITHLSP
jgi:uncharacterized protein (TIGR04255 family)